MICDVRHKELWAEVTSRDIFKVLITSAKNLKLQYRGIDTNMIRAHSLQAGGAMALKIIQYKDSTIRYFGHWTSDKWQINIHSQIEKKIGERRKKDEQPHPVSKHCFY